MLLKSLIYKYKYRHLKENTDAFITINSNCNLKCKMCDVGQKVKRSSGVWQQSISDKLLMPDEWINILDNIKARRVMINGLEPLLYPKFGTLIRKIKESNRRLTVLTNGFLINKWFDDIVNYCDKINISIDGREKVHDEIRGVKGSFKRAYDGLLKLKKKNKTLRVTFSINPDNVDEIIPFYDEIIKPLGVYLNINHYNYIHPSSCKFIDCNPSNMTHYSLQKIDTSKIYDSLQYIKNNYNCRLSPKLITQDQIDTHYKVIPTKHVKMRCHIFDKIINNRAFYIKPNGDFIPFTRCWLLGYIGNALEMDKIPSQSFIFHDMYSLIKTKGLYPQCQRLCCGGNPIL